MTTCIQGGFISDDDLTGLGEGPAYKSMPSLCEFIAIKMLAKYTFHGMEPNI